MNSANCSRKIMFISNQWLPLTLKTEILESGSATGLLRREGEERTTKKYNGACSYTFRELAAAAHNFRDVKLIGQEGFGSVYKGPPRIRTDVEAGKEPLGWSTRLKIAVGAALVLEYLHCKAIPPVIYRDLKSSNILLDNDFNAKLSDFGLAKLKPVGDKTHVST